MDEKNIKVVGAAMVVGGGKTGAFAIAVTSDAWVELNGIWTFVASGTAATMPGEATTGVFGKRQQRMTFFGIPGHETRHHYPGCTVPSRFSSCRRATQRGLYARR